MLSESLSSFELTLEINAQSVCLWFRAISRICWICVNAFITIRNQRRSTSISGSSVWLKHGRSVINQTLLNGEVVLMRVSKPKENNLNICHGQRCCHWPWPLKAESLLTLMVKPLVGMTTKLSRMQSAIVISISVCLSVCLSVQCRYCV